MRRLKIGKGHELFQKVTFKKHETEFMRLVQEGQSPKFLFITCSDSRVIPHLITTANPGDMFVIRNAGNFVPPYDPALPWEGVGASLQFAVEELEVEDIIVCGHSHCGAIEGVFYPGKRDTLLTRWLALGKEAKELVELSESASLEKIQIATYLSVVIQLKRLLTYPFIKEKVDAEKLFLHGWFYTIETGEIECYDPAKRHFVPLTTSH